MNDRVRWGRGLAALAIAVGTISVAVLVLASDIGLFSEGNFTFHFGVVSAGFGLIAWLAFPSQPRNAMVWSLVWAALFGAVANVGQALLAVNAPPGLTSAAQVSTYSPSQLPVGGQVGAMLIGGTWVATLFTILGVGLLLFPDGTPPTRRWRWLLWWNATVIAAITVGLTLVSNPNSTTPIETAGESYDGVVGAVVGQLFFPMVLGVVLAIVSLLVRYRHSLGATRQQIQWIALGGVGFLIGAFTADPVNFSWQLLVGEILLIGAFFIAITKYRLYDVDLVVSKTLTYAMLAVVIGLLYATAILTYINVFADPQQRSTGELGLALPLGATALVAVAFEPIRSRLQRLANRLVYGRRAAPSEVLSRLTVQLSDSSAGQGLDGLARVLQEGTGAVSSVVWLRIGNRLRAEVVSPPEAKTEFHDLGVDAELPGSELELSVPVQHSGEMLGAITIAKPRQHPITAADEELLADVAAAAGLLLRNHRLNAALAARAGELQASRRRLIAAQDAARHRLERDLHDGAQQQVVALKVKLGLARTIAEREGADEVAARVVALADQTQDAVDAMRKVARGIYPPLLEAEGLEVALAAVGRSASIPVRVDVSGVVRYSRQLEDTIYFCLVAAISRAEMAGAASVEVQARGEAEQLLADVTYLAVDHGEDMTPITDRIDTFGGEVTMVVSEQMKTTLSLQFPVAQEVMEPA